MSSPHLSQTAPTHYSVVQFSLGKIVPILGTLIMLGFIGITDLDIVLAGSARAGMAGETAEEEFGEVLALAAAA
jgi:hypothetical protein